MKTRLVITTLLTALVLAFLAGSALGAPLGGPNFRAHLSGSGTSVQGEAIISKSPCGQGIVYRLFASDPTAVTGATLVLADGSELSLLPSDLTLASGPGNGTAAYLLYAFQFPPIGMSVEDLLGALATGESTVIMTGESTTLTGVVH